MVWNFFWPLTPMNKQISPASSKKLRVQMRKTLVTVTCCTAVASVMTFYFTSFTGHRPAQREWAQTGLIGPMRGAIPTQSHNLTTQPSHTTRVYIPLFFFEQWCGFFYIPQEQISESAVGQDLRFFFFIQEDKKSNHLQMSLQRQHKIFSVI